MAIIETLAFTKRVSQFLSDEEYTALQWFLWKVPDAGKVIQGTGGARKVRWKQEGKGKRGGLRVIYFHYTKEQQLWMLALYPKKEKEDLSEDDKQMLKRLVEEIKK